ncbi:acyl-CoA dehydrogenase family protein [Lutimaribacter saemankumensis]|uniref:Acyl-CoA dehydrogenase n=1 Tax=Lutimaribacter saemankumensis TaxID=490829 RepID=A0A1G8SQK7_9RHOB|nr:acyl-CoA dehydrogenase family protein [Lutimaribacter saemankumensis]SDJ31497.1 acyl-CoA dehydrogenase [Lutimaribacter saemankumensis]
MQNPFDTPERRAFRDSVARYVATEITPHVDAWDEAGDVPWSVHEGLGALGIFGFGVDERYGGLGFDDVFMRAAFAEELAKCGATGVGAAVGGRIISIGPLQKLASDEIRDAVLADIVAGRVGSSLAITEPSGGSDVARLKTSARREGGDYVLNGQKAFITGGMKSDYFVVGARTGGEGLEGISLFFVPADTPGFSRADMGPKMGWWASDTAALYLDEVRVPARYLMGEENRGFLSIMGNFNYERITMVAIMLGMMKVCFDHSVAWAQTRETFGKPLIRHQVIRHKLADMSARIDMIEAYLNQICWQANEGAMPVAEISKAKFSASTALEFCASQAMQILGGAGYLRGNPVERMYREVKVQAIGGGSEEIMRDLAVRQMGL